MFTNFRCSFWRSCTYPIIQSLLHSLHFLMLLPVRFVYIAWNKSNKCNIHDCHPREKIRWIRDRYYSKFPHLVKVFSKTIGSNLVLRNISFKDFWIMYKLTYVALLRWSTLHQNWYQTFKKKLHSKLKFSNYENK